ncbi:MAG: GNAT family N-acetyltransferase [Proteobacteria bacterium]|nr:GNAT family N-acetyltransferase [Pseudomonadota bacterium]
MAVRPATAADADALWAILKPAIRAGETYALDRDMTREQALAYWCGTDKQTFVFEEADGVLGTYYLRANQAGGGGHVCNCGYMTAPHATGKGVAWQMCADSLDRARAQGFHAMQFNFVVSTNTRAVALWQCFGFAEVGRLPLAFDHPAHGFVDALVLHRPL